VIRPQVLLMDEPLSNLDAKLRVDLRRDIRALQQALGITTVYVTHDQEEALSVSDRVCVMHDGVVQQVDTPWAIYNRPANRFVATFVGSNNFLPVGVDGEGRAQVLGQALALPAAARDRRGAVAAVRPEKVRIDRAPDGPGVQVPGIVRQSMFGGRELLLTVEVEGHGRLDALTEPSEAMIAHRPGDRVTVSVATRDLLCFAPGETGARLS
jgi:iron(III) transport system ATP-binding protein